MINTQNVILESVENNFSLVPLSFINNLSQFCGSSFAEFFDESFRVSSVVFGADMWTTIGHLSYIQDTYISLHITHTHHNHNNMCIL